MSNVKKYITAVAIIVVTLGFFSSVQADGVKVIIENLSPDNGTWLTPFWVGFHDGSFGVYNLNVAASEELERLAEDGNAGPLSDSFSLSSAGNVQGVIMTGDTLPPFAPGETAEMTFILDGSDPHNRYFSFGSMVIPSNDAFIGNDNSSAYQIYDNGGNFLGAYITIYGTDVKDAGTEVNDEIPMNTAFFGQTTPNTGVDENGVVHIHPGYLPPDSGGILADPMFADADFTQPGYEVARITIVRTQTTVPGGNVSGVWNLAGSPYVLEGDVTVPAGQNLTIEPGVAVIASSIYALNVSGTLTAVGTQTDSILFTGAIPSVGWKGIRFSDADPGCEIAYCIIEKGKNDIWPLEGGGMFASFTDLHIHNCRFSDNKAKYGGAIYLNHSNSVIEENLFSENIGSGGSAGNGGAIYNKYGESQIIHNRFINNEAQASSSFSTAYAQGGALYLEYGSPYVAHNLITGNTCNASGTTLESAGGGIYNFNNSAEVVNNTLSGNSTFAFGYSTQDGGGVAFDGGSTEFRNNIVDNNMGGGLYFTQFTWNVMPEYNDIYGNDENLQGEIPAGLGEITTINYNGDPSDQFYNIFLNPLYNDPQNGDYTLQAGSPAIDAGDPTTPFDPDGTIPDQGAFYFDQGGMPMVEITMTPTNPPIVIPASGGSFLFNVQLANNESQNVNAAVWIMVQLPGGSMYGPVLGPISLTLAGGSSIARDRSQNVPASAPAGTYSYIGYLGIYPNTIWSQDSFTFEKSTSGDANPVNGWENSGQSFETETNELSSDVPTEYRLNGAYPNPFNPTTTISYALPEAAKVSLTVFDVQGRKVADLVNGWRGAGQHEVTFDGSQLSSGMYLTRLQAGDFTAAQKMILVK